MNGVSASDVQKILNLKHAWGFILDKDVLRYPSDFSLISRIARLVNGGFYMDGGRVRGVPVSIGGTAYDPTYSAGFHRGHMTSDLASFDDLPAFASRAGVAARSGRALPGP